MLGFTRSRAAQIARWSLQASPDRPQQHLTVMVSAAAHQVIRQALGSDNMEALVKRVGVVAIVLALAGCASNPLPPPNSIKSRFDPRGGVVRIMVSDIQPLSAADLIGPDGSRFPATAVTLVSGPHVDYSPPPSIGIGVGGFGFSGCCSGFGSGVGVGLPLGGSTPTHVSDQYIGSAVIPVPSNYGQSWGEFRLKVQVGNRPLLLAAPAPAAAG